MLGLLKILEEKIGIDSELYTRKEKVRKYNVQVSPLSPVLDLNVAGKMLRDRFPEWGKQEHESASRKFASDAKKAEQEYNKLLDVAAREAWGRPWKVTDYKVSGVGSDEFPEETKKKLRELVSRTQDMKRAADAHAAAARGRFGGSVEEAKSESIEKAIKAIAKQTDYSDHSGAVVSAAKLVGDKKLTRLAELIVLLHREEGHMPGELMDYRRTVYKRVMEEAKKKLSPGEFDMLQDSF